ncbi:RNA exonuclease 1 homolog [Nasonia vitripennis]|uniref:C3H1-type domain-containing protein n=1 Tax=Nasonia vitripennis TaxID=7425 RepID=A0A7M7LKF3_NASVI|nr:RNA exonuclease 1 homolog [Nasonia vitripennis]
MLPSTGYFKAINCPFYDNGYCERPYCHFRHSRRDASTSSAVVTTEAAQAVSKPQNAEAAAVTSSNSDVIQQLVSEAVKKVLADQNVSDTENIVNRVVEGLKPKLVPVVLSTTTPAVKQEIASPDPIVGRHIGVPAVLPTAKSSACVYNPTPISELRRRHLPIPSYNPARESKAVKRKSPDSEKPWMDVIRNISCLKESKASYTPTAISQINSKEKNSFHGYVPTIKSDTSYDVKSSSKESYIPEKKKKKEIYCPKPKKRREEYVPRKPKVPLKDKQHLEDDSFDILDEVFGNNESNPSVGCDEESQDIMEVDPKFSDDEVTPVGDITKDKDSLEDKVSKILHDGKENKQLQEIIEIDDDSDDKNQIDNEKIEKFDESSKHTREDASKSKNKSSEKSSKEDSKHSKHKDDSKHSKSTEDSKHSKTKEDSKHSKSKDDVSKHSKSKDDDSKHSKSKDKEKSEDRKDKDKSEDRKDKDREKSKDKDKHKHSSKSSEKERSSSSSKDSKSRDKDKDKVKDSKSSKDSSHRSKKDSKSDKERSSSSKSSRDDKKESRDKSRHKSDDKSRHKSKSSSSDLKSKSSRSHKSSDRHSSHSSHKSNKSNEKNATETEDSDKNEDRSDKDEKCDSPEYEEFSPFYDEHLLETSDSDHDVEEECRKIFQEYEVPDTPKDTTSKAPPKPESEGSEDVSKKRVAHPSAASSITKPVGPGQPIKRLPNPQQRMYERWRMMREVAAEKAAEKAAASRAAETALQKKAAESSSAGSQNDSQVNGNGRIRIAQVPYALSLALEKKKVMEQAAKVETKTIAQNKKGGRVAHIPQTVPQLIRPEPLQTAGTQKFGLNVRQFYVNAMQDICIQIYTSGDDAAQRAVREEFACYERCKALNVYKNSCMLTVHRLRKEVDQKNEDPSASHSRTISHEAVLAGKVKGTWSVVKTKKILTDFKGASLYNKLVKWILTDQELKDNGFPRPHPDGPKGRAKLFTTNTRGQSTLSKVPNERFCCRCNKSYMVDKHGFPTRKENCIYHYARKFTFRGESKYMCCKQDGSSDGCCDATTHVWDFVDTENLRGYVSTFDKSNAPAEEQGVFALDCEMCYTTQGLELTRVTVINENKDVVYETLVKPANPIIDYNTRFSGISELDMKSVTTSLQNVQATLLSMFSSKTILIGHSLESDFKALKLLHNTVVDTSVMFPHKNGPPFKRALKTLCSEYLRKIIQNEIGGHDSKEDAVACMELVHWKVREEAKLQ